MMYYDTGLEALTAALKRAKLIDVRVFVFKSGDMFLLSELYATNWAGVAYPGGRTEWRPKHGGKLGASKP